MSERVAALGSSVAAVQLASAEVLKRTRDMPRQHLKVHWALPAVKESLYVQLS